MTKSEARIDQLAARAKAVLKKSETSEAELDQVITELQKLITASPKAGKTLGPLIGKFTKARKVSAQSSIQWIPVLKGHLAIGHRPKVKTINNMKLMNVSHLFTLLSESEGGHQIGRLAHKAGLQWFWLPLPSADPPGRESFDQIVQIFDKIESALQNNARIYIHCSAGIHRTGMITYAFLRYIGIDRQQALNKLTSLRQETIQGVGKERIQWGDQFG